MCSTCLVCVGNLKIFVKRPILWVAERPISMMSRKRQREEKCVFRERESDGVYSSEKDLCEKNVDFRFLAKVRRVKNEENAAYALYSQSPNRDRI